MDKPLRFGIVVLLVFLCPFFLRAQVFAPSKLGDIKKEIVDTLEGVPKSIDKRIITKIVSSFKILPNSDDSLISASKKRIVNSVNKKLSVATDSATKALALNYLKGKLGQTGFKNILHKDSTNKKFISLDDIGVENTLMYLPTVPVKNVPGFLNNVSVLGKITVAKLPLNLDISKTYNTVTGFEPFEGNLFKFNFDRGRMLQSFKSDFQKGLDFKKTVLSNLNVSQYISKSVVAQLKASGIQSQIHPALLPLLNNPSEINSLLKLDEKEIKHKISSLIDSQKEIALSKSKSEVNKQKAKGQEELDIQVSKFTTIVLDLKHKIEQVGLDAQKLQLIQDHLSGKGSVDGLADIMVNELDKSQKIQGIQKFYSKIKELQMGGFGQKIPGSFMNSDLLVKGVNFSIQTGRGPVTLGVASNNEIALPKDAAYNNSVFSSPKILTYVKAPTTHFSFGNGSISWVNQSNLKGESQKQTSLLKNVGALTVSQNLNFQNFGKLTVDVSKSASQYKNTLIPGTQALMLENTALRNYFKNDLFETLSLGFKHSMDAKRLGLSENFFFNYSGLGFQNPGQAGGGGISMRVGGNLKKSFLKNRLMVQMRSDLKQTPTSFTTPGHWNNYQLQLDSRLRLSNKLNFSVKYLDNGISKVEAGAVPVYSSQKFQFDMNTNYKIGKVHHVSHLNLGKQKVMNPASLIGGDFITLNGSQNLILNRLALSATVFYNKELNNYKVLGNMLNSELGCQYTILKLVNISSSVTYLDNEELAKQVGIRQNLQLMLNSKFDISAFVDLRRDLIKPKYPDLYTTSRGELSLRYQLTK